MRKCWRCGALAGLLALGLGLLALPLGKPSIDGALEKEAKAALAKANINGVTAKSDWARIHLSGPAELKAPAIAAVDKFIDHRSAVAGIDYSTATGQTGTQEPTPATAANSPVNVTFRPIGAPARLELTGTVASDADRVALVDAASKAFGKDAIVDKLVVKAGADAPAAEGVQRLAGLISAFGPTVSAGSATLKGDEITVSGEAVNPGAAADANAALKRLTEGEGAVKVTGSIGQGGTAAPTGDVQTSINDLLKIRSIVFATGSGTITPESKVILDKVAAVLSASPNTKVSIEGHTDNQGNKATNRELSQFRAETVRAYLISKGIDGARLTAQGFGDTKPVRTNKTANGRQANRRIDFIVVGS